MCDGLVAADRTPHPSLLELAKVIQPVQIRAVDAARGVLEVTNEHAFVDLAWLQPSWIVHVDGVEIAAGELEPLDTAPGATSVLTIPLPALELVAGQRAHLTLSFRTRADLPWAPAGHEVAWEQFEIAAEPGPSRAPGPAPQSPRTLESLEPTITLWRAPIDNETFGPGHAGRWEQLGVRDGGAELDASTETGPDDDGDGLTVVARGRRSRTRSSTSRASACACASGRACTRSSGSARVRTSATPTAARARGSDVGPRSSTTGPCRTSIRKRAGTASTFAGSASSTPPASRCSRSTSSTTCRSTVARVTDEELDAAGHLEELDVRDECYVWIDVRQRGVGSGACGPDTAPAHRIGPGTYRWSYRLR